MVDLTNNIQLLLDQVVKYRGFSADTFHLLKFTKVEKGLIECEVKVEKELTNTYGVVHGGCIATILDGLGAFCFVSTQDEFQFGFTVNLNINYIAGASIGETIICKSEVDKITKSLAFIKLTAERKDGTLLSNASAIYKVPPQKPKSKL
ncbi:hypothetical protein DICPUDRAFT_81498 [Dictyostelium purpureum]|uniref:Thioesterase domain-containing protein n=1 Tax=Dictyostelium purpureum TaxID=5786 RepID=F0ZTN7_DICPU|nr:uncharacterized protein DICPUDRAFT_81498 [Dictyostelium purpureum]EGC32678.1 hypothetical protein DICPUDRAFT_81498 [Dictyostelium purpureum]|eukprot:XP_003290781.1 hypothetical protein DICPUDRAFT_81498 [Dictyostelium purpureum]